MVCLIIGFGTLTQVGMWRTGELGHTAAECPYVPVKAVESEPAEEPDKQECSVEIGRV